jgi:hypothetical protein
MLTIALIVVVFIVVVLVLAATKPATFEVRRSLSMPASADKIFAVVNDFHRWPEWSPYEKLDPTMKRSLSGAASGKGAIYEWTGNNKAGAGRMEIVESQAPGKVGIQLDFSKPFVAHNLAEFTMQPQGDSTSVTWAMRGPAPFANKLMQVFINLDKMIGKDFEAGLQNLKTLTQP